MTFPTNLAQDNSSDAATERGEAWTSSTIRYQNMLLKACIMQLCATLCPGPSAAGKQLSRCLSENRYVACSEVETLLSSPACATRPFEVASRVSHSSTWCSQPASQPASKPASHSSSGTPQNSPNNPKFKTIMPSTKMLNLVTNKILEVFDGNKDEMSTLTHKHVLVDNDSCSVYLADTLWQWYESTTRTT